MADTVNTIDSVHVRVTEKARGQLAALNVTHDSFLRLWVEEGGCCSGYTYRAAIDSEHETDDITVYRDDLFAIVTDPRSAQLFNGLEIDYSDDLVKAGFRFTNPNASYTCGCGTSFQA
ncbi:MAG: iron-sulfur cluster assembly accessory protein [Spirochaetaceae bacterium]|nr:MAG: iron-sulfur cluster assembly accessory protein [Spirochaetaceae bacterium]